MHLTVKGDGRSRQSSVASATSVPHTTTVTSYLNNIPNNELISKTQTIFEYFSRTTQDLDIAAAMEKLSDVWF